MPLYPGVANAIAPVVSNNSGLALNPGDSVYLLGTLTAGSTQLPVGDNNVTPEAVAAGVSSISACISGRKEAGGPPAVSLMLIFDANPGVFNVQLQEASTDADGCFLTPTAAAYTITAATQKGSRWVAFVDDIPTGGKFMRVLVSLNPNAVNILAKLTLLS